MSLVRAATTVPSEVQHSIELTIVISEDQKGSLHLVRLNVRAKLEESSRNCWVQSHNPWVHGSSFDQQKSLIFSLLVGTSSRSTKQHWSVSEMLVVHALTSTVQTTRFG